MAKKRLTDVEKWKKQFFRKLPCEYKLFWIYILDDCDHCGIWHVDLEIAEIKLGIKLSLEKARGFFLERVVEFDNGHKWFIPDFISFQYGQLDEKNKMYKSIIPTLTKYNLMGDEWGIYPPIVKVKEEVEVKEKRRIEECLRISLIDSRFTKANKTDENELELFNNYLEKQGIYETNPLDYKKYFAKLKGKYPGMLKKEYTVEELKDIARKMDLENGITSSI